MIAASFQKVDSDNEDLEIDLVDDEPPFLTGHTMQSVDLSPVRIVKNPDGSLSKAAMMQGALSKERRELKQQQREAETENEPNIMGKSWNDPLPEQVKGAQPQNTSASLTADTPEWKKNVFGSRNASFGRKSKMSILEQRQSLPI